MELVYEGRREPFANLNDLQNVIRDKWHDVDDQTVRKAILQWKRRLAAVAKQNGRPIKHIFCWSVDWCELLWRSGVACLQQQHIWRTACKHCFMTCNTISLVSRRIWKRFKWKFVKKFENICSLHTCFSANSFHLLCCITPRESSGRFFRATRYIYIYICFVS